MVSNSSDFVIDDALGVTDNLAKFAQELEAIKPELGMVLSGYLNHLASEQSVDSATIWNALEAAITSAEEIEVGQEIT